MSRASGAAYLCAEQASKQAYRQAGGTLHEPHARAHAWHTNTHTHTCLHVVESHRACHKEIARSSVSSSPRKRARVVRACMAGWFGTGEDGGGGSVKSAQRDDDDVEASAYVRANC